MLMTGNYAAIAKWEPARLAVAQTGILPRKWAFFFVAEELVGLASVR
jgi:hypothetical protein